MRFHGIQQAGEDVAALAGDGLQRFQAVGGQRVAQALERRHLANLLALLVFGGADKLQLADAVGAAVFRQEGVHAHQRQAAVVLLVLVVQRLLLDLAALVHGVHRAQHAAALG